MLDNLNAGSFGGTEKFTALWREKKIKSRNTLRREEESSEQQYETLSLSLSLSLPLLASILIEASLRFLSKIGQLSLKNYYTSLARATRSEDVQ